MTAQAFESTNLRRLCPQFRRDPQSWSVFVLFSNVAHTESFQHSYMYETQFYFSWLCSRLICVYSYVAVSRVTGCWRLSSQSSRLFVGFKLSLRSFHHTQTAPFLPLHSLFWCFSGLKLQPTITNKKNIRFSIRADTKPLLNAFRSALLTTTTVLLWILYYVSFIHRQCLIDHFAPSAPVSSVPTCFQRDLSSLSHSFSGFFSPSHPHSLQGLGHRRVI